MSENSDNNPKDVEDLKQVLEAAGYETFIPTHTSRDNAESRCKWCGVKDDLRYDLCFACAEAQAIIGTGTDMYDRGDGGTELPAKEANQRVLLLIRNGWRHVPACAKP